MQRNKTEPVGKSYARLASSFASEKNKGTKVKKQKTGIDLPPVYLQGDDGKIADEVPCVDAWPKAQFLVVGTENIPVAQNPPVLTSLALGGCYQGYPVVPVFTPEHCTEDTVFQWEWRRQPKPDITAAKTKTEKRQLQLLLGIAEEQEGSEVVANTMMYTPCEADIGHRLLVSCQPGDGPISKAQCKAAVQAFPTSEEQLSVITKRMALAKPPNTFRVLSYNILAEAYAKTDHALKVLYPYCDVKFLELSYRQVLLRREIGGWDADIVALQEVGRSVWQNYFYRTMQPLYDGVMDCKAGSVPEGLALLWKKEKYTLEGHDRLVLKEVFQQEQFKELREAMKEHVHLLDVLQQVTTVLQVVELRETTTTASEARRIIVCNTHFFFHPKAAHIRALHAHIAMNYLKKTYPTDALLFLGDLNAVPNCAAYDLLLQKQLPEGHSCWDEGSDFAWGDETDTEGKYAVPPKGLPAFRSKLSHDVNLRSSYKESLGSEPKFTNYVGGFKETLDYIMYTPDHLSVSQISPIPDEDVLSANTALPSAIFPSDHIPVMADLCWN
eukprot:TRINITY_DN95108_c0_g1_i1.p1 TRINITY_DN95108_c0_g1~~TRINITY_DN95108_c0_g1_i1.p1  ORF type:complete len:601 (+),score=60.99 TRINITY_DN95108_c0_g1_i1:142-1803(+)